MYVHGALINIYNVTSERKSKKGTTNNEVHINMMQGGVDLRN